jgi:hypothetical protein
MIALECEHITPRLGVTLLVINLFGDLSAVTGAWVPIASRVTMQPLISRAANNVGTTVISLVLARLWPAASTGSWARIKRFSLAQALTRHSAD